MNFFKKIFSKNKQEHKSQNASEPATHQEETPSPEFSGIATHEYFDKRYQEDQISEVMLDGTLRMIKGYFEANKIKPIVAQPINHPKNLDQTIDDGFGFVLYCKAGQMDEGMAVGILAMAFNHFLMTKHGFKLYKDSEPEYPLRDMTLKYDNEGAKLSLYPIEYTAKVIRYEASYDDLYERIKDNVKTMPTSEEVFNKLMDNL